MLECRSDIKSTHLLAYISSFYKELQPEQLIKNIKTLSASGIKNLQRGRALIKVPLNDIIQSPDYKAVPCNYYGIQEKAGFYTPNACKMLAYKVLYEMEQVPDRIMPVDIFEMNLFFNKHFEGTPKLVFRRFCDHHKIDETETLNTYRRKIKWEDVLNDIPVYKEKPKEKKNTEAEGLINAFFQILK